MRESDKDVLLRIGDDWTYLGPNKSGYAVHTRQRVYEMAAPRPILLRLKAAGLILVRTITIRNWVNDADRRAFESAWGLNHYWQARELSEEAWCAYTDQFYDRVEVQARLTDQGRDVKISLS